MSGIPTFQQLMDDENKEKDELGSNMQIKAPSGGKRRRTRTKKRRVKKTKEKRALENTNVDLPKSDVV